MAYTQTLIDNFADGTIDSTKWTITQGPGATESGGTLNLACVADYPRVEGKTYFNLASGILAAKLSTTGARTSNTEFYIGARNANGNAIAGMGGPAGSYLTFQGSGATTFSNEVITDTTVGIGPSWTADTWWGVGNMGPDNVLRMYNSSDGQTWNEMARCTVGGTFDKTAVGLMFMAGVWDGSTPNLVAIFDDASFWAVQVSTFAVRKVRWGGSWIWATPKVRIDGEWVPASSKPREGDAWDPMT